LIGLGGARSGPGIEVGQDVAVQLQRIREQPDGGRAWPCPAGLDVANGFHIHSGPLGQLVLGQAESYPMRA
jgi:hypothetical protein